VSRSDQNHANYRANILRSFNMRQLSNQYFNDHRSAFSQKIFAYWSLKKSQY